MVGSCHMMGSDLIGGWKLVEEIKAKKKIYYLGGGGSGEATQSIIFYFIFAAFA